METLHNTITVEEETPSEFYASLCGVKDSVVRVKHQRKDDNQQRKYQQKRPGQGVDPGLGTGQGIRPGFVPAGAARVPAKPTATVSTTAKKNRQLPCTSSVAIPSTNMGHKLLSKQGWVEGEALGKEGQGIRFPLSDSGKFCKGGLGLGLDPPAPRKVKSVGASCQQMTKKGKIKLNEDGPPPSSPFKTSGGSFYSSLDPTPAAALTLKEVAAANRREEKRIRLMLNGGEFTREEEKLRRGLGLI